MVRGLRRIRCMAPAACSATASIPSTAAWVKISSTQLAGFSTKVKVKINSSRVSRAYIPSAAVR